MPSTLPMRHQHSSRPLRVTSPRRLADPHYSKSSLYTLFSLLLLGMVVAGAVLTYEIVMRDTIYPGVRVAGVDVGGLRVSEALDRLRALEKANSNARLVLLAADQRWIASPPRLGYTLDIKASVEAAYQVGRHGSLLDNLRAQLSSLAMGITITPHGHLDRSALQHYLSAMAPRISQSPRPPALAILQSGNLLQTAPRAGRRLDIKSAAQQLVHVLVMGGTPTQRLPLIAVQPLQAIASAQHEAARLTRLLAAHLTLQSNGHSWTLSRSEIASLLQLSTQGEGEATRFSDHINSEALAALVWLRAAAIDRPGHDAQVSYTGGIVHVQPGSDGQIVDQSATVARLTSALQQGQDLALTLPLLNGPTVSNAEAQAVAERLQLTLRTTVVWLPQHHWAISPATIAAALHLMRVPKPTGALLLPSLDTQLLEAALPGSRALATQPAQATTATQRAVAATEPNYDALAAEMLASPSGRAVYHLPLKAVS